MHLRQYVLKSILIGTALFFPTIAYAEKADHTPKLPIKTEKVTVQKQTRNQVKKEKPPEESVKPRKYVVKKVDKTMVKKKVLPEQASPKAKEDKPSTGKKPKQVRVVHTSEQKASAIQREKQSINKKQRKSASVNKDASKLTRGKKPLYPKEKIQNSSVTKNEFDYEIKTHSSIIIENNSMLKMSSFENPEFPRNQKNPNPVTSFPKDLYMILSQDSYHSGGSAKDRKKTGFNTYSLNDKWFIRWEKYWLLESNQSFIFQNHKISSQWMNAPPFQPPKFFLFS